MQQYQGQGNMPGMVLPGGVPPIGALNDKHYPYYYNQSISPHNPVNPSLFQGQNPQKLVIH